MKVHGSECDVLIQLVARVLHMYNVHVCTYVDRWRKKKRSIVEEHAHEVQSPQSSLVTLFI